MKDLPICAECGTITRDPHTQHDPACPNVGDHDDCTETEACGDDVCADCCNVCEYLRRFHP